MEAERLTMDLPELAATLSISKNLCYELAKQGKLPVPLIRLGDKRMVVSRKAVLALLEPKDET